MEGWPHGDEFRRPVLLDAVRLGKLLYAQGKSVKRSAICGQCSPKLVFFQRIPLKTGKAIRDDSGQGRAADGSGRGDEGDEPVIHAGSVELCWDSPTEHADASSTVAIWPLARARWIERGA